MDINDSESINLQNAISILNSEGEKQTPYTLTIKNICDTEADYQVNLETINVSNKLNDKYITLKVNNEENKVLSTYEETEGIIKDRVSAYKLYSGHLKKNQVMSFEIRMWIGEEVEATNETLNKGFQSKVTVEATANNKNEEYIEDILNGADPVLKDNLIPVTIDDKGNVYKADTKSAWYNYADKKWANAVILEDNVSVPEVGEKIEESQIESYFVWIPKYSYQLWDLGLYDKATEIDETKPHAIPIRFGLNDTTDKKGECTTPMSEDGSQGLSGGIGECQVGDFMTHPAFISFDVNGIWVGKFETGYKNGENINFDSNLEKTNIVDTSLIIIKPNEYAWRYISIGNAYRNSLNYKKELNSHMIRNTEWGVVAYLSHSNYGINQEIRINNNFSYLTGYSAINSPTTGYTRTNELCSKNPSSCNEYGTSEKGKDGTYNYNYFNQKSIISSTTGNYSGIYDMNGGTWEYVMNYEDSNSFKNSDLTLDDINPLYSEKYNSSYNKRILGDATGEMGPFSIKKYTTSLSWEISSWYEDQSFNFRNSSWILRGGGQHYGTNSGIFSFYYISTADPWYDRGFRIVLAPQAD